MQERLKVFTFVSGHAETMVEPSQAGHINEWLASTHGRLVRVTQSESERPKVGQHVTICLWYIPEESSTFVE
jgi:hypothetical protein